MVVTFENGVELDEVYKLPISGSKENEWRDEEYANIRDMVITFDKGVEVNEPYVLPKETEKKKDKKLL